jgi:hypothetical protein
MDAIVAALVNVDWTVVVLIAVGGNALAVLAKLKGAQI